METPAKSLCLGRACKAPALFDQSHICHCSFLHVKILSRPCEPESRHIPSMRYTRKNDLKTQGTQHLRLRCWHKQLNNIIWLQRGAAHVKFQVNLPH